MGETTSQSGLRRGFACTMRQRSNGAKMPDGRDKTGDFTGFDVLGSGRLVPSK
jgi:hypothetical protein